MENSDDQNLPLIDSDGDDHGVHDWAEEGPQEPSEANEKSRTLRKLEGLLHRIRNETVPIRVHDVIIKGNTKTKDSVIEAEASVLKDVTTMQDLLQASNAVNLRLQELEVFDSVQIVLDSGPLELPDTANVIIEVAETRNPVSGEVGAYTRGEAKSSTIEGSLKFKNIFGYCDLWDGSVAYGFDHMAEVSAGVYMPRFKSLVTPVTARLFLLSQDWLRVSSFKERSLGLSLGLFSSKNHVLGYNLAWRTLSDPSQMGSKSTRRQLGHSLLSSLKYTFKIDQRNSTLRPTSGYAFVSTTQIGGLAPDTRSLRFLRQDLDLRYSLPLGFCRSALNLGVSSGVVFPWGHGCCGAPSPLPERFFLGGNLSPVGSLVGPTTLWGFDTRGVGPSEPRRKLRSSAPDDDVSDSGRDFLGGDIAVNAFADFSFDLPLKWCKANGIHGHVFASAGNVDKLTEGAYKRFSFRKFADSFRSSVGAGIILPMNLFRLELNYCQLLKKHDYDSGKSGFRVSFSTP